MHSEVLHVRPERTGWRDLSLSARHRGWGFDCPAVDVDFMLEYDNGKAAALVEYKHERASEVDTGHPTFTALADLGDRAGLPVFVVRYAADFSWFCVKPLNRQAERWHPQETRMTEGAWVETLYAIRAETRFD